MARLISPIALLAFLSATPAVAFTPAARKCPTTFIRSTAVEAETTEATASAPKKPQLTRFDRLKKSWKGPMPNVDTSGVDFSYGDFEAILDESLVAFNRNDIVKGTVVQYEKAGALIDIGAKSSAYLPLPEAALLQGQTDGIEDLVELDSEHEFQIISDEDENGQLLVSRKRIQYAAAWEKVASLQVTDDVFDAKVVAVNRGGAICLVEGLRAFLPGSHLTGRIPDGKTFLVKIMLKSSLLMVY
uniref:S1 motif domain-containing protein n=1 Tax=Corethron hystrix TaxID=216773 RepID=A0A7S1FTC9_9STRA|mmetsp:Transcript_30203/g.69232  ORF Transcript_30203/g.69232 Transcript_30203/m.69232 type:complete len:244 (+) Transcript_30203:212-943(+)